MVARVLSLVITAFFAVAVTARAAEQGSFSPKDRQAELAQLRAFAYPPGFSDDTIVSLENGVVPATITVPEYLRLHCGEMNQIVLNPCLLGYGTGDMGAYTVVTLGGTRTFTRREDAVAYFKTQVSDTVMMFEDEVMTMNTFIDEFCDKVAAGEDPRQILADRGGRPRLPHAIAPPNGAAKYQFSNIFQWEKCDHCVGIIAVNQAMHDSMPRCGAIRKQGEPRINYFVVDQRTSQGHRSLDEGLSAFEELSKQPSF